MKKNTLYIIVLVALSIALYASQKDSNVPQTEKADASVVNDADEAKPHKAERMLLPAYGKDEMLVEHKGYTLVYNKKLNTPKWVAWTLTADETYGDVPRSTKFYADPQIPTSYRVDWYDYKESGYDRGHMCPSGDNKWDALAMKECFYMSNMCPQVPSLNSGSWKTLETACRDWARNEGEIYIVCGPVYKRGKHEMIGIDHAIAVPEGFFKVVLTLREGNEKAVGFYYRNDTSKQPMNKVAMSVDEVEKITGIDFYPSLDDALEERLESAFIML